MEDEVCNLQCIGEYESHNAGFICDDQQYGKLEYRFVVIDGETIDFEYLNGLFQGETRLVVNDAALDGKGFEMTIDISYRELKKNNNYILVFRNQLGSFAYYKLKVKKNGSS